MTAYAAFDEALEAMTGLGPDLANGMTSHAPMVAEALCAMDRPDAVMPWLKANIKDILPWPKTTARIAEAHWHDALGRGERTADWRDFFREELQDASWHAVLDKWVDRLAPGFCAAATHGVIRVGHATRALVEDETPLRRVELADAFASWAASYQELPTDPNARKARLSPREAIAEVAVVPRERRRYEGSITSSLRSLSAFAPFKHVIGLIDGEGDLRTAAPQFTETFARVYVANAHDTLTSIVFIHGVTSVAALANIAPHVGVATAARVLPFAWQAGAGLYAAFGARPSPNAEPERVPEDVAILIDRAVSHGDDHVIKFTEACTRFDAIKPSPAYGVAVKHAIATLPRG